MKRADSMFGAQALQLKKMKPKEIENTTEKCGVDQGRSDFIVCKDTTFTRLTQKKKKGRGDA